MLVIASLRSRRSVRSAPPTVPAPSNPIRTVLMVGSLSCRRCPTRCRSRAEKVTGARTFDEAVLRTTRARGDAVSADKRSGGRFESLGKPDVGDAVVVEPVQRRDNHR